MVQIRKGYHFDDLALVPKYSRVRSRSEVNLSTVISFNPRNNTSIRIKCPIISANMDTITGQKMATAMANYGAAGILHRYQTLSNTLESIKAMKSANIYPIIPSIGVDKIGNNSSADIALGYLHAGADAICIDIAHGDSAKMVETIDWIHRKDPTAHIIAGNVATGTAVMHLAEAGATSIKVGIGQGSVCTTKLQTGCTVPQMTAVMDCVDIAKAWQVPIISDGGINTAGDIVKALAAGASAIMTGKLLAATDEAEEPTAYRGMASENAMHSWRGKAKFIEGITITDIYPAGRLSAKLDQLVDGIRSGFSYCNAMNIEELWRNAEFIGVS